MSTHKIDLFFCGTTDSDLIGDTVVAVVAATRLIILKLRCLPIIVIVNGRRRRKSQAEAALQTTVRQSL